MQSAHAHIYFKTWNLTKVGLLDPSLGNKLRIHDPNRQNHVSSNLGELLVGIEHKMFRSIAHPEPTNNS